MSTTYDNWERLVAATLKREQFRQLALAHSRESSFSSIQSDFSFDSPLYSDPEVPGHPNMCNPSARSNISNRFLSVKSSAASLPTPRSEVEILSPPYVKAFSFYELKSATRNFGKGGFGYVFKGWINVKKLKFEGFQSQQGWLAKVNYLGQLQHTNLVKLIGYCIEADKRLLVYEFLPRGSLEDHLFRRGPQPLSWAIRMKVAIGAARGLAFLHGPEEHVIYRDFKASNILLDEEFNAKLSDFGLANTEVIGARDNAEPEYVRSSLALLKRTRSEIERRLSAKSNVYSFGVVLLELLSGRQAVDKTKVGIEQNLVEWATPYMFDKRKLFRIMDTKMEGQYPQKAAFGVAAISLQCLCNEPELRPHMADVLATLEKLQARKSTRMELARKVFS